MAEKRVQRRLAAILSADMVGYSRLIEADEEGTRARLEGLYSELINPQIASDGGRIVKTMGDGILAEFPSSVDAVRSALALQSALARRDTNIPADRRIRFRIGINVGDVIVEGDDIHGDGVNIAARLEQVARPGCICVSEDIYRQVRGKVDVTWTDLGEQRLKNLSRPVRAYTTGVPAEAGAKRRLAGFLRGRRFVKAVATAGAVSAVIITLWAVHWTNGGRLIGAASDLLGFATTTTTRPVIVVLPLSDRTTDGNHRFFADGFTEELIGALGRFNAIRVISRNAVLQYKDRPIDLAAIRSQFGATYFVEGSVQRSGRSIRIAAQLIDAKTGEVRWTDRHDGKLSDSFEFQDAIARQIAGTVAANVTLLEGKRRVDRQRPSDDVHDLILEARATGFGASRSSNRTFRSLVNKALELDPGYAAAHAFLAEATYSRVILGWTEFADRELTQAEASARRAIELAPAEPDGYRALGRILVVRGEYDQAQAALKRAIEINPSDANALAVWGSVQAFVGKLPTATEALESALKFDPTLEPNYVFDLSVIFYLARRNGDALRTAELGIARYPAFPMFNVAAAVAAAQLGQKELAKRYVAEVRRRLPFFNVETFGSRFRDASHRAHLRAGLSAAGL